MKRAGIYLRVSTKDQTTGNQQHELESVAKRRGWQIVGVYEDAGISGAKGGNDRPALNRLLTDARRGKLDVVMCWSIDRLGRSLKDLLETVDKLSRDNVDLYIDQNDLDTTTAAGKLLFHITGAFSEFERGLIQERVRAGIKRAKDSGTKSGLPIGRPKLDDKLRDKIKRLRQEGLSVAKVAEQVGVGRSTVKRIQKESLLSL